MNKETSICPKEEAEVLARVFGLQSTSMEPKKPSAFEPHSSIPDTYVHIKTGGHYSAHVNKDGHTIYTHISGPKPASMTV